MTTSVCIIFFFFFFNDTATTEIYTLSLHDALPISAVDRIVPEQDTTGIDVLVEPYFEWVVDASQIKEERPNVSGISYVEGLGPYIERKLLTVNTGHSAIAYLGYVRGKPTIHAALEDNKIRETASK